MNDTLSAAEIFAELLTPQFRIDAKYQELDPALDDAGSFPLIYRDEPLGWRFHMGGSIFAETAQAAFALALFRRALYGTMQLEPLRQGSLYVVFQPRIAHLGERLPGVDGQTVLYRKLFRLDRSTQ